MAGPVGGDERRTKRRGVLCLALILVVLIVLIGVVAGIVVSQQDNGKGSLADVVLDDNDIESVARDIPGVDINGDTGNDSTTDEVVVDDANGGASGDVEDTDEDGTKNSTDGSGTEDGTDGNNGDSGSDGGSDADDVNDGSNGNTDDKDEDEDTDEIINSMDGSGVTDNTDEDSDAVDDTNGSSNSTDADEDIDAGDDTNGANNSTDSDEDIDGANNATDIDGANTTDVDIDDANNTTDTDGANTTDADIDGTNTTDADGANTTDVDVDGTNTTNTDSNNTTDVDVDDANNATDTDGANTTDVDIDDANNTTDADEDVDAANNTTDADEDADADEDVDDTSDANDTDENDVDDANDATDADDADDAVDDSNGAGGENDGNSNGNNNPNTEENRARGEKVENFLKNFNWDTTISPDMLVGAYYYPWHGDNFHYGQTYLRHQLDPIQLPTLGEYDDSKPETVAQHLAWSRQANIGLWVTSWWGEGGRDDWTIRNTILPHEDLGDHKISLLYETTSRVKHAENYTIQRVGPDMEFMCENFFDHPNYLTIDDRPVLFIYLSRVLWQVGALGAVVAKMKETVKAKCGKDLYVVGDHTFRGPPLLYLEYGAFNILDAATSYDVYGGMTQQEYYAGIKNVDKYYIRQLRWMALADTHNCTYIPGVTPGFNDLGVRLEAAHPPLSRRLTPEMDEGTLLRAALSRAMKMTNKASKHILMVNSFNEWHEDTQIEPTAGNVTTSPFELTRGIEYDGYGELYLDILRECTLGGSTCFNSSTPSTTY